MREGKGMRAGVLAGGLALALAAASSTQAAVFSLDFEGVSAAHGAPPGYVGEFYNGGTSSSGTSGVNYGVSFGATAKAFCLNTQDLTCSTASRGGQGDPASAETGMYFLFAEDAYINVAAGFDTAFSFNQADFSSGQGVVEIYSGLDGTGDLLATLKLPGNSPGCPDYDALHCPFTALGVSFAGVAKSVSFMGASDIYGAIIDDVTFGSLRPGAGAAPGVPEPSAWATMLLGFFGAGAVVRGARRRAVARA